MANVLVLVGVICLAGAFLLGIEVVKQLKELEKEDL